jgi:hypothetical protein
MASNERAARLSQAGYDKLLGRDQPTRDIESGLEHFNHKGEKLGPTAKPTAEQIRAEMKARYPESWERATKMRTQRGAAQVDLILLEGHVLAAAIENGDLDEAEGSRLMIANAIKLKQASPQAFQELVTQMDTAHIEEAEEYEEDIASYRDLRGQQLASAVELEEASMKLAHSEEMIAGILNMNFQKFEAGCNELGFTLEPDDPESIAFYETVSDYAASGVGYRPSEIAAEHPDEALTLMRRARDQLAAQGKQHAEADFKSEILSATTPDVASGLESEADRAEKRHAEMLAELRKASGQPDPAYELKVFDPDLEVAYTREEAEGTDPPETLEEFKASVLTEPEKSIKSDSAFTRGGEAVTLEEASRNPEAEAAAQRTVAESRFGV